jgi:N6-adenosine-specific RNA methylase IME4
MTQLVAYEHACAALAAAVTADEVMAVRTTAEGIRAVARVAKNLDLEIKAVKLRTGAEVKLGDMLIEAEKSGVIASHGGQPKAKNEGSEGEPSSPATLKEIGVDKKLSAYSRKLSGIGAKAVNMMLDRFDRESRTRGRLALDVIQGETAKRNAASRRQLAQELSDCAALQPTGRLFPLVYGDPAWRRKAGIGNRAYENHYDTMTWDEIIAMPVVERLLPDAWIFLWIPRAHLLALHPVEIETPLGKVTVKLPLAWAVARAWGADDYSTCHIWHKTDEWDDTDHGTGLIFWDQDEVLCLFKRGRGLPMPDGATKFASSYREDAAGHSAKPTFYRTMINAMTGGLPVLELFAREDDEHVLPPNFYTWGNQSNGTADEPLPSDGRVTARSDGKESGHLPEVTQPVDAKGAHIPHDHQTGEVVPA